MPFATTHPMIERARLVADHLHALSFVTARSVEAAFMLVALSPVRLSLLGSKPIPVCKPIRHGRSTTVDPPQ